LELERLRRRLSLPGAVGSADRFAAKFAKARAAIAKDLGGRQELPADNSASILVTTSSLREYVRSLQPQWSDWAGTNGHVTR
jgi:hypothetical protein